MKRGRHKKISLILVEGPDCSGKSTLAERVKNTLRWDLVSMHHKGGDQFNRYQREYSSADNRVFDRGHISESVYGFLWRGKNPFSKEEEKSLNFSLIRRGIIIFACPSLKVMRERYLERKFPQQISIDELEQSRGLFLKRFRGVSHLNYYSKNAEELNEIVDKIKGMVG